MATPASTLTGNAPNRRSVEMLFRELRRACGDWTTPEIRAAHEEETLLREGILGKNVKYTALKAKIKRLETAHRRSRNDRIAAVTRVEREYLAKGLTKDVLGKIARLVARFNR